MSPKGVTEKAKTRSIGHGSVRDDYVLRARVGSSPSLATKKNRLAYEWVY